MRVDRPPIGDDPDLRAAAAAGGAREARAYAEHLERLAHPHNTDQAIPWWERAAQAGDLGAACHRADLALKRGEWTAAEHWYRIGAETNGRCALGLARVLHRVGDPEEALEWYRRGADLGENECLTRGALLLARLGRSSSPWLSEASDRCDEYADNLTSLIGEVNDHTDLCWTVLRSLERGEGLSTEAAQYLEGLCSDSAEDALTAAEGDGDLAPALQEFLLVFCKKRFDWVWQAVPSELDGLRPLYVEVSRLLGDLKWVAVYGEIHTNAGRYADAAAIVEEHLDRFPDPNGYGVYQLGEFNHSLGRTSEARRWYQRVAEDGHVGAQWRLVVLAGREGRITEALSWSRRLRDNPERDPSTLTDERIEEYLDGWRAKADDAALSQEQANRLAGLREAADDGDTTAAFEAAELLRGSLACPEAASLYRRALDVGDTRAGLALGRMLHESCHAEPDAVTDLVRPSAEADDPEAMEYLARLMLGSRRAVTFDNKEEAERWFRDAARAGVARAAWWAADKSYQWDGHDDIQEAVRLWIVAAEAGLTTPAWRAGRWLSTWGFHEAAEPLLRMADEDDLDPRVPRYRILRHLGESLSGQGRDEEAAEVLRDAVEWFQLTDDAQVPGGVRFRADPRDASIFDPRISLMLVLERLGRYDEAVELAREDLARRSPNANTLRVMSRAAERAGDPATALGHLERMLPDLVKDGDRAAMERLRTALPEESTEESPAGD